MAAEPWDRERALEQVGGDHDLLNELIDLFIEDSDQLMNKLGSAVGSAEPTEVEHLAHTFKGSVMNFAADRTRDLAFTLEKMGRAGDLAGADSVLAELRAEYARLSQSMRGSSASVLE